MSEVVLRYFYSGLYRSTPTTRDHVGYYSLPYRHLELQLGTRRQEPIFWTKLIKVVILDVREAGIKWSFWSFLGFRASRCFPVPPRHQLSRIEDGQK